MNYNCNLNKDYQIGFDDKFLIESFDEITSFVKKIHAKEIILVTDEKIWINCCDYFKNFLTKYKINLLILENPICSKDYAEKLSSKIVDESFIIVVGSGTLNDLCKYLAIKKNLKFVTFASAASMNGYLSKNCSIKIANFKTSIPATSPLKVYVDLRLLKTAPLNMIKSGIGDMMCFYSCYFDWYLAHMLFSYELNWQSINHLKDKMDNFVKNYQNFELNDEDLYLQVIEILLLSGQAMTIAQGSYPASQSEHLIAHAIEMKYPKIGSLRLHGEFIAITTLTSSALQLKLLENFYNLYQDLTSKIYDDFDKKILNFFGKEIGKSCIEEYKKKQQIIKLSDFKDKNNILEIKNKLKSIYLDEKKLRNIFNHFNLNIDISYLKLNANDYSEVVKHAKFIRNRLTCLDFLS